MRESLGVYEPHRRNEGERWDPGKTLLARGEEHHGRTIGPSIVPWMWTGGAGAYTLGPERW